MKNTLFFATGGEIVSTLFLVLRYRITLEMKVSNMLIWILVVTLVGTIYGIVFWTFNILLLKIRK